MRVAAGGSIIFLISGRQLQVGWVCSSAGEIIKDVLRCTSKPDLCSQVGPGVVVWIEDIISSFFQDVDDEVHIGGIHPIKGFTSDADVVKNSLEMLADKVVPLIIGSVGQLVFRDALDLF